MKALRSILSWPCNSKAVDLIIAVAGGEYEGIVAGAASKDIIFSAAGDDAATAGGGEGILVVGADDVFDAVQIVSAGVTVISC